MSLTRLKSSRSSISSETLCENRSARATSRPDPLAKGPLVGQPGELVGHGLLADELVQGDVLDRRGRLAEQIPKHVTLVGRERPAGPRHGHRADRIAQPPHPKQRAGQGMGAVGVCAHHLSLAKRLLLGRQGGLLHRRRRTARLRLSTRAAGERDQAVVRLAGPDSGLDHDPEQCLAIESGGERRADALHGALDLRPLAAKLVHLLAEATAHLVELARQARHLVRSLHRNLAAEVALADPPRGAEHLGHLPLQSAPQQDDEDQSDREEGHQGGGDTGAGREKARRLDWAEERQAQALGPGQPAHRRAGLLSLELELRPFAGRRQIEGLGRHGPAERLPHPLRASPRAHR